MNKELVIAAYDKDLDWIEKITGANRSQTDKEVMDAAKSVVANVKADAVEEFASVLCSPKCGFEYRLSDAAKVYADSLRKTMITTSSESSLSEVVNKINEEL